jgi:hypothetical protein
MIQPSAKTPIAANSTDSGEAMPPPLPEALMTPTTSGITNAEEKTGPVKPTDWAMTSSSDRRLVPKRSYDSGFPSVSPGDRGEVP